MARIRVAATLTAIFALGLAAKLAAAGPATVSYAARKRYIKMCMVLVPESRFHNISTNPGYNNSDPWMPYLLNASPMKPAGWEFINSLAKPVILGDPDLIAAGDEYKNLEHKGGKWFNWYSGPNNAWIGTPASKDKPGYWVVKLSDVTAEDLAKFDLLLIVAHHTLYFSDRERDLLARAVDAGAVLWVDNSRFSDGMQLRNFFLQPRADFRIIAQENVPHWRKAPLDLTHPLLNGVYQITPTQVIDIGDREVDDRLIAGVAGYGGIDGTTHGSDADGRPYNWSGSLFEVIHNSPVGAGLDTGAPAVAAGPYGSGYVILSACNIAARIADWWEFANIANGQNPDVDKPRADAPPPVESQGAFGFAYNVVYWATMWRAEHRSQRHIGSVGHDLPPPLTEMWRVPSHWEVATYTRDLKRTAASAIVSRRVLLMPSYTGLWAFDTDPGRAANPYGPIDDGLLDQLYGTPFDLIAGPLGGVGPLVGAPAVATVYDPTYIRPGTSVQGWPRELAYVVKGDPLAATISAYRVDPADSGFGTSGWPQAQLQIPGGVNTGPLYSRGLVLLPTLWKPTGTDAARTGRIVAFDAASGSFDAGSTDPVIEVAINEITGGAAKLATLPSPLATATVTMWGTPGNKTIGDDVSVPVEVMIVAGNAMPLAGIPSYADFGRLWVVPLRVRAQVPNWSGGGLKVFDSDGKEIPAVDSGNAPNWVIDRESNTVTIVFTRWSLFREYRYRPPTPGIAGGLTVRYPVINRPAGTLQEQSNLPFLSGDAVNLGAPVARYPLPANAWSMLADPAEARGAVAPTAAPCVVGTDAYMVTDSAISNAAELRAQPHIYGGVTRIALTGGSEAQAQWRFLGDRTAFGADPTEQFSYHSDFPFTPTYANDTLYVTSNYSFVQHLLTAAYAGLGPADPTSVLYALDPHPATMLMRIDGNLCTNLPRVLAYPMDRQPPEGASASPNFNEQNAPVWLSSNAAYGDNFIDASTPELPPTTIDRNKYYVDFETGQIRLDASVFGQFSGGQVHIQYFVNGQPQAHNMCVRDMVKWRAYFWPEQDPVNQGIQWYSRICTPAVAVDGNIYVGVVAWNAQDPAIATLMRGYVYAFKDVYPEDAVIDASAPQEYLRSGVTVYPRVWRYLLDEWPVTGDLVLDSYGVSEPAVDGTRLFVSTGRGNPLAAAGEGTLHCLANARTVIADNYRLLEVDQGGRAQWAASGTNVVDPGKPRTKVDLPAVGDEPAKTQWLTNYVQQSLSRVSKVRRVAGDRWLVCDTGNDRVVEIDRQGNVVWQYPDSDLSLPDEDQYQPYRTATPTDMRLLMPMDARRYTWQSGNTYYEATLIADAGHYRVLKIVRAYPNGTYDPAQSRQEVVAGPDTTLGKLMFITAEYWQWPGTEEPTGDILCAVGNPPLAPGWAGHQFAALVKVQGSSVSPAFVPRSSSLYDFLYTVDTEMGRDPVTQQWQTVVVDATGVKVIDNDTWPTLRQPEDPDPVPVFEVVSSIDDAPWLTAEWGDPPALTAPFAAYDEEIGYAAVSGLGFQGIINADAYIGADEQCTGDPNSVPCRIKAAGDAYKSYPYFRAVAARRLPNGRLLVVNGDSRLFQIAGMTLDISGPSKSEVFELDMNLTPGTVYTRLQRGQRLFAPGSDYFVVPNPLTTDYPDVAGKTYNLKQPLFADRY